MKNKFTFLTLLFTSFVSYSQIKTNYSKPHISVVVAPFSDFYDIEYDSLFNYTQYASDFYILDIDDSMASLNLTFNPKAKYKKSKKKIYSKDRNFENEVTQIAKQYSGKMIASLFLKDGAFDYENLFNKGLENLTEDQRAGFSPTMQGLETTARDRLIYPIIESNYLFVISPGKDDKVVWSVFKVSIANDESNKAPNSKNRLDSFLNLYSNNPAGIVSSEFPVKLLSYGIIKGSILSDLLISGQVSKLDQVIIKAQKEVLELRKRSLILDDLKIALGSKDSIKVDDLMISYREIEDENGNITLQKMGRDRVKKVGNNNIDLIANPKAKGERTQLYADGGRVSRRGYIALEKKEVAVGISTGVNFADYVVPYVKVDYRLGGITNISSLRNTFLIIEAEFLTGVEYSGVDYDTAIIVNAGLRKTFNLGRKYNVSVFGLYSVSSSGTNLNLNEDTAELDVKQYKAGVSFALKFGSLQIIPHIAYVFDEKNADDSFDDFGPSSDNIYGKDLFFGAGLRYSF